MQTYRYKMFSDIDEDALYAFSAFLDTISNNSAVTIEITSHGGLVFYGNAMFQKIQEAQREGISFTARVYGIAASSAADIVLACDRVEMAETAAIMIHSAWNANGKKDPGIEIANAAQLDVIRRRIPEYTEDDLQSDRWFTAREALAVGLIDGIFNAEKDAEQARLCASYLAQYKGGGTMAEEKKEMVDNAEEIVEEEEIKKEEERGPSVEDVLERLAERLDRIEERLMRLEGTNAECGGDRRDNARLKAVFDRIANISKPCIPCGDVMRTAPDPKAELDRCKAKYPDIDRIVGND